MALIIADRIKETSTTAGTAALALAGAVAGFRPFSAVCVAGDRCYYAAVSRTTAEWEVGLGTYASGNTLQRTTVQASSNAGAAVSFSGATLDVWLNFGAAQAQWVREIPSSSPTYYVRKDGSDSNTGRVNNAGGAFLTVTRAIEALAGVDYNGMDVSIMVAAGTYTESLYVPVLVNCFSINVTGVGATTIINGGDGDCFVNDTYSPLSPILYLSSCKLVAPQGSCLQAGGLGIIQFGQVEFGAALNAHIRAIAGGTVQSVNNYSISGGAARHIAAEDGGKFHDTSPRTVTLTGTPAFATAFALADTGSKIMLAGNTFSGSATGKRYQATLNSVIKSGGTILPGSVAGTVASGGQYA